MSTSMAKAEAGLAHIAQDRQMEAIQRILSQRTPQSEIRVRDGRGGQKLKYTDGAYVIRTLNEALGWDWDFVADSEELLMNGEIPFEIKVRGTLTVRMNGRTVTKTQYGCQPIEMKRDGTAPVSIGDCYKGAATDALKKCASMLGIALDLYDSDYRADKYVDVEPEGQQPTGAKPAQLPKVKGVAVGVIERARALGWNEANLQREIEAVYKLQIMPGELVPTIETMPNSQRLELEQRLQSELETRGKQ